MAVLVEGISVIARRDAINLRFRDGWQGFVSEVRNQTLCMDAQIARAGFMNPLDAGAFVDTLVARGLVAWKPPGVFVDLVVIDQGSGPTGPCDWIDFFRIPFQTGQVSVARLKGNNERALVVPEGWTFQNSLSRTAIFQPDDAPNEHLEFLRSENNVDVYRDRRNGREVYVGRTAPRQRLQTDV